VETTLAFDLDNVLYDWTNATFTYFLSQGLVTKETNFKSFWNREGEFSNKMFWNHFCNTPFLYTMQSIRISDLEVLQNLSRKYRLFYVTSRPKSVRSATVAWLERWDVPQRENLILTLDKRSALLEINCKLFIDDRKKEIDAVADITTAVLFKANYHTFNDVKGYRYIANLVEVFELLRSLEDE